MDTSKIIRGVVSSGRYTVTAPIVKEDYGLYLKIEGVELPSTYEVDFSNSENSGTSVTMIGNADGVLIPHQFIETGKDVFAFLYHVGENFGRTVYKFRIPNKVRPDRTNEEPTPEEQSVIDQAISALNDAVDQTAQDKADADVSAQNASADAERAEEARTDAQNYATQAEQATDDAQTYANNASASATASAQSAQNASQSAQSAQDALEEFTTPTASATTLLEGSNATASYSNGNFAFGIPRGDKGERGERGLQGIQGETGQAGRDGTDGISPTVTITPITGGHRITITDADGEHSADVMDGTGNVDDVQINGSSIVTDGVANVPVASSLQFGVVKAYIGNGITVDANGVVTIEKASDSAVKNCYGLTRPIVPSNQHSSAFYGLAKAAGDTTQSQSSNAVGEYTESAKSAIQDMIGIDEWKLVAEETLAEDGGFDITIANSAREVYIYAEIEIASDTTSLVAEAYNDSGTRVYFQTFGGQIKENQKKITVLQLTPIATEVKALVYFGKDVYTNDGHFDWQHKEFNVGKLNRFRITAYGSTIQIPTGSIVRIFAR